MYNYVYVYYKYKIHVGSLYINNIKDLKLWKIPLLNIID